MAIQNGQERLDKIRQAMHKEIDELLDTPNLIGFKIIFEAGVSKVLMATVERQTYVGKERLFMTLPATPIEERRNITDAVTKESDIALLGLSSRSYNTLKRAGINTVDKLVSYTKEDLKNVHYLGDHSLREIIGRLADCGFTLKEAENG